MNEYYFKENVLYQPPYRILMMSDSILMNTGYATVTKELANGLSRSKDFDPFMLAYNHPGQTLRAGTTLIDGEVINFPIIGSGARAYCEDTMEYNIKSLNCDIFWITTDTFFMWPWFMSKNFTPAKSVFWFPSDGGGGLPRQKEGNDCISLLQKVDLPVAYSKFAQKQVKDKYGMDVPYIPLGVNTNRFYPLDKNRRTMLKENAIVYDCNNNPIKGVLKNKFVIGSVFRNQPRKHVCRFIATAKRLLKYHGIEDFVFLLHTDPEDVAQASHLPTIAKEEGVAHKIFFTGMKYYKGFPSNKMNDVYNLFDVFYLTTSGEGWGMCNVEAMSAGIPCVITDYTTTQEQLVENGVCGLPVKLSGVNEEEETEYNTNGEIVGSWTVKRAIIDTHDGAKKLIKLKNNPELRERYGKVGREKAVRLYSWDVVLEQWKKLLKELVEK